MFARVIALAAAVSLAIAAPYRGFPDVSAKGELIMGFIAQRQGHLAVFASLFTLGFLFSPGLVFPQSSLFAGKTITIIHGRDPGGTGDMRVRAMLPYLQKYIPGNPRIVTEYMPGGGSRKAANHVFQMASTDGLTIGNLSSGMVAAAVLGQKGVLYDVDKFFYLGSPFRSHVAVFVTRKEAGLNSIEKLRETPGIRIGGQSVGFSVYNEARIFAYILGLKEPKFVTGYSGTEMDVALESGEIDARSSAADSMVKRKREWLEKKLVDFHATIEVPKGEKHPQFSTVPELETFAKNDTERKVMALQRAFRLTGQPFVLPPSTDKERVRILQEAFRKTYQDPEFHKEYKKFTADEPTPLLPEDHERAIKEIPREREPIEIFKQLIGAGPLPPRL
jgi:tripartite-type tricarboxylate transporter receptor subunit TctC